MPLQFDAGKESLAMFFTDWQIESLRYLWSIHPEGANSRAVYENVNKTLEASISRASVINYLNAMVDDAMLNYAETTGKGGHHRVYTIAYTETEFKRHIAELVISKLLKEYPLEAGKALRQVQENPVPLI